jgi:hypothetical protein
MDLAIQLSVGKGKVLCKTHWILRLQIPHQYSDDVDFIIGPKWAYGDTWGMEKVERRRFSFS